MINWLEQLNKFGIFIFGIAIGGGIGMYKNPQLAIYIAAGLLLVTGVLAVILVKKEKSQ